MTPELETFTGFDAGCWPIEAIFARSISGPRPPHKARREIVLRPKAVAFVARHDRSLLPADRTGKARNGAD